MKKKIQLKKILIAIDESPFSEHAMAYGHQFAAKMGAKVALVHVNEFPMMPTYVGNMVVGEAPTVIPEMLSAQEEASKALFKRIKKEWGDDVPLETFTRMGDVRDEILNQAEEWKADLLILGTHGRTGFDHFISGSVAESVARKSHCPVLIIPNK